MTFPRLIHWRSEGLRLRKQPLACFALFALFLVLVASATSAGFDSRAWREAAARDSTAFDERLRAAIEKAQNSALGPANAIATYQLGRGDLGATRMPVDLGLGLGVHRLAVLPVQLKASLDSRQVEARDPGPLKNPLLTNSGLPGVPAMAALLIPLVALVLCSGLRQEEQEQGRLELLRVQSIHGLAPVLLAALGWRLLALWAVAVVATAPALLLDPVSNSLALTKWAGALGVFCAAWVVFSGLLSWLPISGAASMLAGLGVWLTLTFAAPAGLVMMAEKESPMPSRLKSIVALRDAQHKSEDNEQALAEAWYTEHPEVQAQLPATWPASFVTRVLEQDLALEPVVYEFSESRAEQADFVSRWSWVSPGLALVLFGERLAGTDAKSHARYVETVDAFEQRWRDFLVPTVMSRKGLSPDQLPQLPRFSYQKSSPTASAQQLEPLAASQRR